MFKPRFAMLEVKANQYNVIFPISCNLGEIDFSFQPWPDFVMDFHVKSAAIL